jgi:polysaccharide biosynthesis protein VpsQ
VKIRWLAVSFAVFIAIIIILADLGYLQPILWFVHEVENLDKVLHFLLIGTLTYLVSAGLIESFPYKNAKQIILGTIIFLLLFFTMEEFSQVGIRERSFSLIDLAANYLGILVFGFFAWQKYRRVRREN